MAEKTEKTKKEKVGEGGKRTGKGQRGAEKTGQGGECRKKTEGQDVA